MKLQGRPSPNTASQSGDTSEDAGEARQGSTPACYDLERKAGGNVPNSPPLQSQATVRLSSPAANYKTTQNKLPLFSS